PIAREPTHTRRAGRHYRPVCRGGKPAGRKSPQAPATAAAERARSAVDDHDLNAAAVLLAAFRACRAEAGEVDPVGRNALAGQVLLDRHGPLAAESLVGFPVAL